MIGLAALTVIVLMNAGTQVSFHPLDLKSTEVVVNGARIGTVRGLGASSFAGGKAPVAHTQTPAEPMFLGYPHGPKTGDWAPEGRMADTWSLTIERGHEVSVEVPGDVAPCTVAADAPLISTFGDAPSVLDNAVYDRAGDWLLAARGEHVSLRQSRNGYRLTISGPGRLELQPDYYRNHRGYFLWDRSRPLWTKPVAGWCSWAAYGQSVTEDEVARAAEFFGRTLLTYGYTVIQIDDGYQRVLQITDNHQPITEPFSDYWTKPNDKFPSGMAAMAKKIAACGMTPGIWVGLYLPLGLQHAADYVTGSDGQPLQGPWVGYSMQPYDSAAVAEAYTNTLKTFRAEGWHYFKIDTLRHVLYDSYRRVPEYWKLRGTDSSHAFRHLFEQVRDAVGKDNYLLACWGALPELAGLPDGCRIGEDVGPSFASMRKAAKYIAQFHYANDVVWRSDPDYMCFRVPLEQCRTWATLTSLTGGHVMVSDPIEAYDPDRVEVLRRVGPPPMIRPGNTAPLAPDPEWLTFNAVKDGERWTVAARMAWTAKPSTELALDSIGLQSDQEYLAFDFWKSRFLGEVKSRVTFEPLAEGACQVVSFRPATGKPQILGDDRHVSQGAVELERVRFAGQTLSGRFLRTPHHSWHVFVHVPDGWKLESASVAAREAEPHVVELAMPSGEGWLAWSCRFSRAQ